MAAFLDVLWISALPAAGNLIGALVAERVPIGGRLIGATLHAAAGVAIAVVSVELMPRILLADVAPWLMLVGFLAGAAFSVAVARGVHRTAGKAKGASRAWMLYATVSADLFSDGLLTGIGSSVTARLGLVLGLSQVVANVPGGFAAGANFQHKGISRPVRLIAAASLLAPSMLAALVGYWVLRGAPVEWRAVALTFVVGVLLLATVEDVVPQADEPRTERWITTSAFALGFGGFALLSLYVDPGG